MFVLSSTSFVPITVKSAVSLAILNLPPHDDNEYENGRTYKYIIDAGVPNGVFDGLTKYLRDEGYKNVGTYWARDFFFSMTVEETAMRKKSVKEGQAKRSAETRRRRREDGA